ncbi:MAG: DUF3365 domain-containing protein [Scytonema sp. PMC 1069.18]|nr:DUF3365 domain-containing protein [Scytonema sp. PMC 1069.18]MEC4881001.1 DUF3365 domain-containing protein [Scytonema sp. PMC 1070.18]
MGKLFNAFFKEFMGASIMLKSRLQNLYRLILCISLTFLVLSLNPVRAWAEPNIPNPAELARAIEDIENLDAMRSGLASTLERTQEEPTIQTMKEICRPVGMRAAQLSQENDWQVKQIAAKYRNPAHAPDNLHSKMALTKFEQNPKLIGFWERETLNEQAGTRYYRRINVEASCLVCHGAKDNRPQFVQDKYPQDLAYNFKVGDLRGMYAVFISDIQKALQEATNQE